jgi:hypothetical protein
VQAPITPPPQITTRISFLREFVAKLECYARIHGLNRAMQTQSPDDDRSDEPRTWRLAFMSGVFAFPTIIGVVAYISMVVIAFTQTGVEPARTIGAPLRVATAGMDAIFMLTAQQEERVVGGMSRWMAYRGFETVTHVDLWRFDLASGQPAWRKRLVTGRGTSIFDYALWGADGDRIWMFMREPQVRAAANGDLIADASVIEARNPQLKGVLPRQTTHYQFFDQYGLAFTAADARAWLLDGQTLAAVSWPNKTIAPKPSAVAPPRSAGSSITVFQKRGLLLPRDWLGVLTEEEAATLNAEAKVPGAEPGERRGALAAYMEYAMAPPDLTHDGPKRYRLWRAKVEQISAAPLGWPKELPDKWGKRNRYSSFSPFEKSPEFLQAGLLSDGRSALPLYLTNPDSVLVLHRNRIDNLGRLHVTRIAGPDARTVWDAPLPLSSMESVMPGRERLVLFGRERGDPRTTEAEWLITIDLASGAMQTFSVSGADFPAQGN